jgi:hypothetical protein
MHKPPSTAYAGADPFIFVSYSHLDSEIVYQAIEQLCAQYFRIWYDEGIKAGRIWSEVLDTKIKDACCVIAFVSPNSANSRHVANELSAAQRYGKQLFPIYLASTNVPESLADYISSFQALAYPEASSHGRWTELINALPPTTREFKTPHEQLQFLASALQDPVIMGAFREQRREELGWCSIHRRGAPYDDFVQTCKLCGGTDWFETRGLGSPGPSASCGICGLSRDPGRAKPWFDKVEVRETNRFVTCLKCGHGAEYAYDDGPPLLCPMCGRLE